MSTTTVTAPAELQPSRGPFRLAFGVVIAIVVVIVLGAMTTSTGSGLAFADWPLSDGEFMPERSLTTVDGFLEHFHRLAAASAGLMALALAIWMVVARRGSMAARVVAWFGGSLIAVQGVIGGTGVLAELPVWSSVTHGVLAQVILSIFACLTYLLSQRYQDTRPVADAAPGAGRKLMVFTVVLLIGQTVLGGIARHGNSSHALWTHAGNALTVFLVVVIASGFAAGRLGSIPGLRGIARSLATLLILQIVLGFVALIIRNSAGKTPENVANLGTAAVISVHVLLGALLTVLAATLAAHVFRGTRRVG